jgi:hypothetical protein
MNFDQPMPGEDIFVVVDLVPFGIERRHENIALLRISVIEDSSGGGFRVEGFEEGPAGYGGTMRKTRIGPHGHGLSLWLLIANASYALSRAKFEGA